MRHILTSVVLIVLLFPALTLGETVKFEDLMVREGLFYKKFLDIPFTGRTTGMEQWTLGTARKTVLMSVTTKTDSYGQKEPTRTV